MQDDRNSNSSRTPAHNHNNLWEIYFDIKQSLWERILYVQNVHVDVETHKSVEAYLSLSKFEKQNLKSLGLD